MVFIGGELAGGNEQQLTGAQAEFASVKAALLRGEGVKAVGIEAGAGQFIEAAAFFENKMAGGAVIFFVNDNEHVGEAGEQALCGVVEQVGNERRAVVKMEAVRGVNDAGAAGAEARGEAAKNAADGRVAVKERNVVAVD